MAHGLHGSLHAVSCLTRTSIVCYSVDEDKIFERILADNWEAKDRCVIHFLRQICCSNGHCDTCLVRLVNIYKAPFTG